MTEFDNIEYNLNKIGSGEYAVVYKIEINNINYVVKKFLYDKDYYSEKNIYTKIKLPTFITIKKNQNINQHIKNI